MNQSISPVSTNFLMGKWDLLRGSRDILLDWILLSKNNKYVYLIIFLIILCFRFIELNFDSFIRVT